MEYSVMLAILLSILCLSAESSSHLSSTAFTDVESLLAFKTCVTKDPFSVFASWVLTNSHAHHHCNWTGVQCSAQRNPRVVGIILPNLKIQGSISPQLGNISQLQELDLHGNSFCGGIPASLARLKKLKRLDISGNNRLGGQIPASVGALVGLQQFNGSGCGYTGQIPAALCNCSRLMILDLSGNSLTGPIPNETGFLSLLTILDLHNNSLSGTLPVSLANATHLKKLSIFQNNIAGFLPPEIGKLSKLEHLYIMDNDFSGVIPDTVANLTAMRRFAVAGNKFDGPIPTWYGNLKSLTFLELASNKFVSGVSNLNEPIPVLKALSNCSNLDVINLENNLLTGTLHRDIGKFWPRIRFLSFYHNSISGAIPTSIGNMTSLIGFYMNTNLLQGQLPQSIGNMESLQLVRLGYNRLNGTIPREIGQLKKNLYFLDIERNQLSGSIPTSIGELENLRELNLSMNNLSGQIPKELGRCSLLDSLDLSDNMFTGSIPKEVANLKHIEGDFDLSRNNLSGQVPYELGGMQMAQNIDLSDNQFSGEIGQIIQEWLAVQTLNLSFNHFSGNLPASIGEKLLSLQVIDLSHNSFSGSVPPSLTKLSNLQYLNFSYNNFHGMIASCSGGFKNLNKISFSENPYLCSSCFGITDCKKEGKQHLRVLKILMVTFISAGVSVAFLVLWFFFYLRRSQSSRKAEIQGEQFNFISRNEIVRATDNLDSRNLLGQGGQGQIYRGIFRGTMVAIKIFFSASSNHKNLSSETRSFLRECETLGAIRHRNLVKIITACCEEKLKALVFPLMPNGNLHEFLHKKLENGRFREFSLQSRVRMLKEIASGLCYLHHDCTPAIFHCDVKPENVLLDEDMTAKLCDFGIARLVGNLEETIAKSISSGLKGSIGYIPPEYGAGGGISSKGDVYSFGIILLEVMTRMKPTNPRFGGEDDPTLRRWVAMALANEDGQEREEVWSAMFNTQDGGQMQFENEGQCFAVENLLRLGLLCTSESPDRRPTMRDVEMLLADIAVDIAQTLSSSSFPDMESISTS